MNALITGGAGFIGSHLAARCAGMGYRVRVLDHFLASSSDRLSAGGVDVVDGCVTDAPLVRKLARDMDVVFHLAALVGVAESFEDPEETARINVGGTEAVVDACLSGGVRKLVFASSAAVYGNTTHSPQHEALAPAPRSPYASSKLSGERLIEAQRLHGRLNSACLRFFNVYGPGQSAAGIYAPAVPSIISRALRNEAITIHGDGEQVRDFIFVEDVVSALLTAAVPGRTGGIMNVGTGGETSVKTLVTLILALTGSNSPVDHAPLRAGDSLASRACIARLRGTGWEPCVTLEDGLRATLGGFMLAAGG